MVSPRRPSLLARMGAVAMGLSIGAAGFVGFAPMFRAPSSSPLSAKGEVDGPVPTAGACVSDLGGGGWRLKGTPLTQTPLGCVPAPPASRAEARPSRPRPRARAAPRTREALAPKQVTPPTAEVRATHLKGREALQPTPPNASVSPSTSVAVPPPATTVPTPVAVAPGHKDKRPPKIPLPDLNPETPPRHDKTKG